MEQRKKQVLFLIPAFFAISILVLVTMIFEVAGREGLSEKAFKHAINAYGIFHRGGF